MTPLSTRSSAPSSSSTEVKVIRAEPGVARRRTFASPFRKERLSVSAEVAAEREPDIMDELDRLLGGDFELDEHGEPDEVAASPKKGVRKAPTRKSAAPRAKKAAVQAVPVAAEPATAEPATAAVSEPSRTELPDVAAPVPATISPSAPVAGATQAPARPDAVGQPDGVIAPLDPSTLPALADAVAATPAPVPSEAERALHRRGADAANWLATRVGAGLEKTLGEVRRDLMRLSRTSRATLGDSTDDVRMHQVVAALLLKHGFGLDKRQPAERSGFSVSLGPGTAGPVVAFLIEGGSPDASPHHAEVAAVAGAAVALASAARGLGLTVRVIGVPSGRGGLASVEQAGLLRDVTVVLGAGVGSEDAVSLVQGASREWGLRFVAPASLPSTAPSVDPLDAVELSRAALGMLVRRLPEGVSVSLLDLGEDQESERAAAQAAVSLRASSADVLESVAERVLGCAEGGARAAGVRLVVSSPDGNPEGGSRGSGHDGVRQDAVLIGAYRSAVSRRGRDVEFSAESPRTPLLAAASVGVPCLVATIGGAGADPLDVDETLLDAAYGLALAGAAGALAGTARS